MEWAGLFLALEIPAVLATARAAERNNLTVDYLAEGSIFPPDISAPVFLWRDAVPNVTAWRIDIAFADGGAP